MLLLVSIFLYFLYLFSLPLPNEMDEDVSGITDILILFMQTQPSLLPMLAPTALVLAPLHLHNDFIYAEYSFILA